MKSVWTESRKATAPSTVPPGEPKVISSGEGGVSAEMVSPYCNTSLPPCQADRKYAAPPAYDNPGTRQITVAAPPSAQSSVARAQLWYTGSVTGAVWTSTQFRAYGLADGYVVEAFVTGQDLGFASSLALAAGAEVGMDLAFDVSFPTDQGPDAGGFGNRLGEYYLRVAAPDAGGGIPPFDPRAFCVPTLGPM